MNTYSKGTGLRDATYARGGEKLAPTRSRFIKTPDTFRTDIQRTSYGKSSPGGELAKVSGDTKSQKPVKPQA